MATGSGLVDTRGLTKPPRFSGREADRKDFKFVFEAFAGLLSHEVIDYFKNLSIECGVPYQTLIDLYLLDCARSKKKLKIHWAA